MWQPSDGLATAKRLSHKVEMGLLKMERMTDKSDTNESNKESEDDERRKK